MFTYEETHEELFNAAVKHVHNLIMDDETTGDYVDQIAKHEYQNVTGVKIPDQDRDMMDDDDTYWYIVSTITSQLVAGALYKMFAHMGRNQ